MACAWQLLRQLLPRPPTLHNRAWERVRRTKSLDKLTLLLQWLCGAKMRAILL